ncbi:anaerobic ribonucleoside-triphosphate reductase, partial [Bifidobacteriaceae bacterium WP021]
MQVLEETAVTSAENCTDDVVEIPVSRVQVEKRDGRVVDFDPLNIIMAIKAAFKDLGKEVGPQEEQLIRNISDHIEAEIQDR